MDRRIYMGVRLSNNPPVSGAICLVEAQEFYFEKHVLPQVTPKATLPAIAGVNASPTFSFDRAKPISNRKGCHTQKDLGRRVFLFPPNYQRPIANTRSCRSKNGRRIKALEIPY